MSGSTSLRVATAALLGLGCLAASATASASTPPAAPTGIHVAAATHTSFTVAMNKAAHTTRYVVYASRTRSELNYDNLGKHYAGRTRASSSKPRVTLSGLTYTTAVYYYRVRTENSSATKLSTIREGHVAPYKPGSVRVVDPSGNGHRVALTWTPVSTDGYAIEQATNSSFTANRTWYTVTGQSAEFTPYRIAHGGHYYFRMRATNGGASYSPWAARVSASFAGHQLPVKVLAYNVLHAMFDGTQESGNTVADWLTQRLPKAAALIEQANPDVMSIEEADDYVPPTSKTTQVSTLRAYLGTHYNLSYGLANGDDADGNPRVGNYVLYRTDKFQPVGKAGRWTLSPDRWATYVELRSIATGAKFYVVSIHLAQVGTSAVPNVVTLRKQETEVLLADVAKISVPIIFAGDFNSYAGQGSQDTAGQVMLSHHVADSMASAQSRSVTQYGTVNDYHRVPPLHSKRYIDRFFTTPGVGVSSWTQILHLTKGAFVGVIPSDHNPIVGGVIVQY